jgi:hypothetical protein
VRERLPDILLFLLELPGRAHHFCEVQPVDAEEAERFDEAGGEAEGHPLGVGQLEAGVEGVLEVDVDELALLGEQDVVAVAVAQPHHVAQVRPLRVGAHEVAVPAPPVPDVLGPVVDELRKPDSALAAVAAVVDLEQPAVGVGGLAALQVGEDEGLDLLELGEDFVDDGVDGAAVGAVLDGDQVLGEVDDLVGDVAVDEADLLEEVGSVALHAVLLHPHAPLDDHLHRQVVLLPHVHQVEDRLQRR